MSDRRRFLKGLSVAVGRERPVHRPITFCRDIALHQAGIRSNSHFPASMKMAN